MSDFCLSILSLEKRSRTGAGVDLRATVWSAVVLEWGTEQARFWRVAGSVASAHKGGSLALNRNGKYKHNIIIAV